MIKVLESFANYSGSGYYLPGEIVKLSPENESLEISLGRAESFEETETQKEDKTKKTTKEDKTKLQTKELKVEESKGEK